jgi:predicted dithiol-disulfide oxidoreductase (DUF899 family)
MHTNPIVSRDEWLVARRALLQKEKAATRMRDSVNAERRALPWVRLDKAYMFDTAAGRRSLADLFDGRRQLMIYHFMLGPDANAGCPGCSFMADHLDGTLPHLQHHDVSLVVVSRAELPKIQAYQTRMGWRFPWVSSFGSDFNYDFQVSFTPEQLERDTISYNFTEIPRAQGNDELPGVSAFYKDDEGVVFHTYSTYARGPEEWLGTLMILDRAPFGRNEAVNSDWVRRHDEYEETQATACCHS